MAKKKTPGHKWALTKETDTHFVYTCKACKWVTLNGVPLPVPQDEECAG